VRPSARPPLAPPIARATPGREITLWGFPGAVACRTLSVPRLPVSVEVGCDVHPERSH
jgi:hypothetical protein